MEHNASHRIGCVKKLASFPVNIMPQIYVYNPALWRSLLARLRFVLISVHSFYKHSVQQSNACSHLWLSVISTYNATIIKTSFVNEHLHQAKHCHISTIVLFIEANIA